LEGILIPSSGYIIKPIIYFRKRLYIHMFYKLWGIEINSKHIKTVLIVGITSLFIFSTVTPMAFGDNSKAKNYELSKDMDNLYACYCFDKHNPSGIFSRERFFLMDSYTDDFISRNERDVPEHTAATGLNEMIKEESTVADDGPMDSAWPMFGHDVRHTGRSSFGAKGIGVEKWKLDLSTGSIHSSPAIDKDGTIYIGISPTTGIDNFYAINPDGTLKWSFKAGGWNWVQSSPAIAADGTIYVGCDDGYLYAINPNGTEKWRLNIGRWVFSSPTIGDDGTIYVGSTNNNFYAVNPDGTLKWIFETNYKIYSSPALDDEGTIYIGSHDYNLYAIYPNGTLKWKYKAGREVKSPPAIGENGTIYFGSWDNYVYAVNTDGELKWKFATGDATETSPAIAPDGTIYVGSYNGKIFSISPNGTENWSFQSEDVYTNWVISSPAIDRYGTIYVGSNDGNLYALNPDGTLNWKYYVVDSIQSSPAIGEDGTIYFGTRSSGNLYSIEVVETEPPEKPTITGPSRGKSGMIYNFTFTIHDSDLDDVYLFVDWGDGTGSSWQGPYASDVDITLNHSWLEKGIYTLRAKAKDIHGVESDWTIFKVTMPKNKEDNVNPFFLRFLENHPYLFPIMKHILEP
jgi:outer membrane protein assembly factor BamB